MTMMIINLHLMMLKEVKEEREEDAKAEASNIYM